jgi:acyl-coenzyme A thioesterase PaaI-like protein
MTALQNLSQDGAAREPRGSLTIRTLAMPADTNHYGDIFGGWLLGQMDIAGGIIAAAITGGRTATVAVDAMTFRKPCFCRKRHVHLHRSNTHRYNVDHRARRGLGDPT